MKHLLLFALLVVGAGPFALAQGPPPENGPTTTRFQDNIQATGIDTAEKHNRVKPGRAATSSSRVVEREATKETPKNPVVVGLLSFILGAIAATLLWKLRQPTVEPVENKTYASFEADDSNPFYRRYQRYKTKFQESEKHNARLLSRINELESTSPDEERPTRTRDNRPPKRGANRAPVNAPFDPPYHPNDAAMAPLPTLFFRYAPAQEGGFIEERKVVTDALPQLPIMLTVDLRIPDRATFILNPYVNQAKLIGDGLEQLRDYFDFTLPAGKIASVTAAEAGQLRRQYDGWEVIRPAQLLVR